ncbi:MAG: non-canonical purine NTP pyrophosphatase [Candidatus Levyibacteriota bacterium]
MQKLLVATKNKGKILEIKKYLSDLPLELISLSDVGIIDDVEENGLTYEENSQKKALFYAKRSGLPVISDDGGLEIHAINNEPGIRSRRWLGYEGTDEELLKHLQKVSNELPEEDRNAQFVAVLTFALPTGEYWSEKGVVHGEIARNPHPKLLHGYPYRSFFFLPHIQKYYHESELTIDEEKAYNHRYKAIEKLKPIIKKVLDL